MSEDGTIIRGKRGMPYYWIVGEFNGRLVVDGPKDTEDEALRFGYEKWDIPFDVVMKRTSNRAEATAALKHDRLEQTGSIEKAVMRAKHQL